MAITMKRLIAPATMIVLTGCANLLAGFLGEALDVPLEAKVIAEKVEPSTLIATDRTSCEVTRKRWDEAQVGETSICAWSGQSNRAGSRSDDLVAPALPPHPNEL